MFYNVLQRPNFIGIGSTPIPMKLGCCLTLCTGEQVSWKQVSVMIGYKRSIPEKLSRSQARMGRGSPLCEQLCEQIAQPFKNNYMYLSASMVPSQMCKLPMKSVHYLMIMR